MHMYDSFLVTVSSLDMDHHDTFFHMYDDHRLVVFHKHFHMCMSFDRLFQNYKQRFGEFHEMHSVVRRAHHMFHIRVGDKSLHNSDFDKILIYHIYSHNV